MYLGSAWMDFSADGPRVPRIVIDITALVEGAGDKEGGRGGKGYGRLFNRLMESTASSKREGAHTLSVCLSVCLYAYIHMYMSTIYYYSRIMTTL